MLHVLLTMIGDFIAHFLLEPHFDITLAERSPMLYHNNFFTRFIDLSLTGKKYELLTAGGIVLVLRSKISASGVNSEPVFC